MVCMSGRYVRIDPRNKTHGQGYAGWLDGIGYPRRVKARIVRSGPLLHQNKSTTAAAAVTPSSVAAADSSTSMSAAAAAAKIQPVKKKKKKKKKRPKFGAIINLLRLGKKTHKKKKKI